MVLLTIHIPPLLVYGNRADGRVLISENFFPLPVIVESRFFLIVYCHNRTHLIEFDGYARRARPESVLGLVLAGVLEQALHVHLADLKDDDDDDLTLLHLKLVIGANCGRSFKVQSE